MQRTGGAAVEDVLVVPAHVPGLVIGDDVRLRQPQVALAGARVAEAARAQHDARQRRKLLHLPAGREQAAVSAAPLLGQMYVCGAKMLHRPVLQ